MNLATLEGVSTEELTKAWNRCWEGYPYATKFREHQMEAWIEKCKIDLAHSMSLKDNGEIVGFSFLAVDGLEGWVAGACIDPLYRGNNLFTDLFKKQLEKAQELDMVKVTLEVLENNHAIRVYSKLGFQIQRELLLFRYKGEDLSLKPRKKGVFLRKVSLDEYFLARNVGGFKPPWQRRESYLRSFAPLEAWLNNDGSSGALFLGPGELLLDAWVSNWQEAEKLISWILSFSKGDLNLLNQPKDYLTAYLTQQGLSPTDIQYEMIAYLPVIES